MRLRGRQSLAELTVQSLATVESLERPDAPYDLTDEQADEWRRIVNRLEADWFPAETHPMLAALCCHIVRRRKMENLATAAEQKEPFDFPAYDKIAQAIERESRTIASLMTRMRLTQQSTYDRKKKKPALIEAPWNKARKRG